MFILKPLLRGPDDDVGAAGMTTDEIGTPIEDIDAAPPPAEEPAAAPDTGEPAPTEGEALLDAVTKAVEGATKPAEPAPDAKPAEPAAAPTDPAAADKAATEALYQIPRGLNGEARAKFKALSDHARALDTQFSEVKQQHEQVSQRLGGFEEVVKDSGATGEMLAAHFGYIKAINSGDYKSALAFIESERQALAQVMGEALPGVDLLADFPDLRQRVDNLELDEKSAQELAQARRSNQQHQTHQAQAQQAEMMRQQQAEQMAARQQAANAIQAWEAERQANDIDFAAKSALVQRYLAKESTKQILGKLPPSLWLEHIRDYYDELQVTAAPAIASRTPQPLRPKGPGGKVVKTAASPLDAVNQALGTG